MIMELYHLGMSSRFTSWTIHKTAQYFTVSNGLVSENLKLANSFHSNENVYNCVTRQDALDKLNHE